MIVAELRILLDVMPGDLEVKFSTVYCDNLLVPDFVHTQGDFLVFELREEEGV